MNEPVPIELGCICDPASYKLRKPEFEKRLRLHEAWASFLSHAWCINVKDRGDRFWRSAQEFHRAGLCKLVLFHRVEKPKSKDIPAPYKHMVGAFGCWRSHQEVNNQSFGEKQTKPFRQQGRLSLVLEDDVYFGAHLSAAAVRSIGGYLLRNGRALDLFYLGHLPVNGGFPVALLESGLTVMRVRTHLTHAYVMTERGHDRFRFSTFGEDGCLHVDHWFKQNMVQQAVFPQLALQNDSVSSNLNGSQLLHPPTKGARDLAFVSQHHLYIDLFFCWVLPVLLPLLFISLALSLLFRSWAVLISLLALSSALISLGAFTLLRRADKLRIPTRE